MGLRNLRILFITVSMGVGVGVGKVVIGTMVRTHEFRTVCITSA